jgi:anti-sigma B factor antagonist
MIVEKRSLENATLLRVEGVVRLGESAEFFSRTLERVLEEDEGDVLIDLSRINYIDSTGLGELIGYLGRFGERDRRLALIRPSDVIVKLLRVAQLESQFPTYDSVEAAQADAPGDAAG